MVIENILREEITGVNKKTVKRRKSLRKLLENPIIEEEGRELHLDYTCLKKIEERCNIPIDDIFLPITFFVPAGLSEGYVMDERDARVVESFIGYISERNGRYWVKKYRIRELVSKCRGCFQVVILP